MKHKTIDSPKNELPVVAKIAGHSRYQRKYCLPRREHFRALLRETGSKMDSLGNGSVYLLNVENNDLNEVHTEEKSWFGRETNGRTARIFLSFQ